MTDREGLYPHSPQAKYEVEQIAKELREYAEADEVISSEELALKVWRAAKRLRPVRSSSK